MAKSLTCNFTGKDLLESNLSPLEVDPLTFINVFLPLTQINYTPILRKISARYMVVGLASRVVQMSRATDAETHQPKIIREYSVTLTLHVPDLEDIDDPNIVQVEDATIKEDRLHRLKEKLQNKIGQPGEFNYFATILNVSSGFCTLNFKIVTEFK